MSQYINPTPFTRRNPINRKVLGLKFTVKKKVIANAMGVDYV